MSQQSKPCRIQLRRTKGWRMPPDTVKVDRTTRWGNPYRIRPYKEGWGVWGRRDTLLTWYTDRAEAEQDALTLYRRHLMRALRIQPDYLAPLRGKDLACWCREGALCHADILLRYANDPEGLCN